MKYQFGFLSIFLVSRLMAVDLSSLISDTSQDQPTVVAKKSKKVVFVNQDQEQNASVQVTPKKNRPHFLGVENLTIFSDSDYQAAINILNDQNKRKIYNDYLSSIKEYFMTYYLINAKALKKIKKRQQVIDLASLEQLSNQGVVQAKVKKLSVLNLGSLSDITGLKKIQKKENPLNLSSLISLNQQSSTDSTPAPVKSAKKKPSLASLINN